MLPYWKCLGFVLYIVLYFSVLDCFEKWPKESAWSAFFKVLPMMHLVFIVVSTSTEDDVKLKSSCYRYYTLLGLLISSIGDVLLIWKPYFAYGVASFGVAQLLNSLAFGFRPFGGGPTFASFGVVAVGSFMYIIELMQEEITVKVMMLLYILIVSNSMWRAMVQCQNEVNVENVCAVFGTMLFAVSDFLIALDQYKGSFHCAPFWIMLTYYTAQLGITLSACNTTDVNMKTMGKPKKS